MPKEDRGAVAEAEGLPAAAAKGLPAAAAKGLPSDRMVRTYHERGALNTRGYLGCNINRIKQLRHDMLHVMKRFELLRKVNRKNIDVIKSLATQKKAFKKEITQLKKRLRRQEWVAA